MTLKARVPPIDGIDRAHQQFLESVDLRQLALAEVENLDPAASLADVIAKITEMLNTHRRR